MNLELKSQLNKENFDFRDYFWFNNLTLDYDIEININQKIPPFLKKIMTAAITRTNDMNGIHYDSIISNIFKKNVIFIEHEQLKELVANLNNYYNLDLYDCFSLQIKLYNGNNYLFVMTGHAGYTEDEEIPIEDVCYPMCAQYIHDKDYLDRKKDGFYMTFLNNYSSDMETQFQKFYFGERDRLGLDDNNNPIEIND